MPKPILRSLHLPAAAAVRVAGFLGLAVATMACDGGTSQYELIDWRAPVPAGQWVRIRNTSGTVRVGHTTGQVAEVRVISRVRPRRSDMRILVDSAGGNFVVCAVLSHGARCDEESYRLGSRGFWNRIRFLGRPGNQQAEFMVLLPSGVNVDASSVNGGLSIADVDGEVMAKTVNGGIKAEVGAAASFTASTVNGGINVRVDSLTGDGDVTLKTVNGSLTAELPTELDADVHLETVNGNISTEYPLTVNGKVNPRRIDATLGDGGRRLTLKTVNGSVKLARRE